jgi:hypothetical protein
MLLNSRYRRMASCTTQGEGETPPLFRLMILRSTVNACWISRQKLSSRAISSALRPTVDLVAEYTRSSPPGRSQAKPAALNNVRRCILPLSTRPNGTTDDQKYNFKAYCISRPRLA